MKHRAGRSDSPLLSRFLFGLSLVFLAFGLVNLGWAMWPEGQQRVQLAIPSGVLPGAPAGTTYASLADYTLTVAWPGWVRVGRTGEITIDLVPAASAAAPEIVEAPLKGVQTVLIEPVLPGLPLTPPGMVQSSLGKEQALSVDWTASPPDAGIYPGKVYVSFGFFDPDLDTLVRVPVVVVDVEIQAVSLWGLEANLVLWLGVVGLALWGTLFVLGRFVDGQGIN
jgi:hypothetical protein